jgi:hypothetical protein
MRLCDVVGTESIPNCVNSERFGGGVLGVGARPLIIKVGAKLLNGLNGGKEVVS